jgi:hypothetical protein
LSVGLFLRPALLIDRPVPVLAKCKADKSERHKQSSGHHHPMGVFPIEQQVEHFAPLSRLFPLRLRQVDPILAEFGRPLGEPVLALGTFFRRPLAHFFA